VSYRVNVTVSVTRVLDDEFKKETYYFHHSPVCLDFLGYAQARHDLAYVGVYPDYMLPLLPPYYTMQFQP